MSGSSHFAPALYVRSAQSGSEIACNDDALTAGATRCVGTGGTSADHGARLPSVATTRGLNAIYVDNNTAAAGMNYTLRYSIR